VPIRFNGTTDFIVLSLGNLGFAFSPGTMALVMSPRDLSTQQQAFCTGTSSAGRYLLFTNLGAGDHRLELVCDTGTASFSSVEMNVVNDWYIVAVTLSASGATPRFHVKNITNPAAGQQGHVDGSATVAATGVPVTQGRISGSQTGLSAWVNGDIACVGVWNIALSDAQVDALDGGLQAWFAPGQPKGLWLLDQAAISMLVSDMSGGGANESSRTGTSVGDASCPWSPQLVGAGGPVIL
jgi:Concanavalin A-like lectin/glucanases superfamily